MQIVNVILILIILFGFSVHSSISRVMIKANATADQCPQGEIQVVIEDCKKQRFTLNATVSNWFANIKPIVKWNVSGARIMRGQGTWSINVIGSKSRKPTVVALTVTGDRLPEACIVKVRKVIEPCS